jgi:hypothetical protein
MLEKYVYSGSYEWFGKNAHVSNPISEAWQHFDEHSLINHVFGVKSGDPFDGFSGWWPSALDNDVYDDFYLRFMRPASNALRYEFFGSEFNFFGVQYDADTYTGAGGSYFPTSGYTNKYFTSATDPNNFHPADLDKNNVVLDNLPFNGFLPVHIPSGVQTGTQVVNRNIMIHGSPTGIGSFVVPAGASNSNPCHVYLLVYFDPYLFPPEILYNNGRVRLQNSNPYMSQSINIFFGWDDVEYV